MINQQVILNINGTQLQTYNVNLTEPCGIIGTTRITFSTSIDNYSFLAELFRAGDAVDISNKKIGFNMLGDKFIISKIETDLASINVKMVGVCKFELPK